MDFFDNAFTFSNNVSKITCCHPNNTFEVATCGQGTSCAGQCSALGASLCPSGQCSDDPRTCEISFPKESSDDQPGGGQSTATLSGTDLAWCTSDGCRVRVHKGCCYNPICLTWKGRAEACDWLNYLTGMKNSDNYRFEDSSPNFRQDMSIPWQPSPWQLDLRDARDSNPGNLLFG